MIEISDLSYTYRKKQILKHARFKVNNGKLYGIFGPHGAGKSTLLALLAGALTPQEGYVRINGFDMAREPIAAKRCVGYLPQSPAFYKSMTVFEWLDFVAEAKGIRDDRRFIHVHERLEQHGMEQLRDLEIGRLDAFGMARLGVLQAIVGDPEILLLDAPTEGLNDAQAGAIRETVRALAEDGKTVFVASASPTEILELCSEVLLMSDGCLEAPVPIGELMDGIYLDLSVRGERDAVQTVLAELPSLISCRLIGREGELLRFRLKAMGINAPSDVRLALSRAGLPAERVEEAQLGINEAVLRSVAKGCRYEGAEAAAYALSPDAYDDNGEKEDAE